MKTQKLAHALIMVYI